MLDFETMQIDVQYVNDNHQVVTLSPGMAREIRFAYLDEVVRMRSMMYMDSHNNLMKQFLRIRMEGDLTLYSLYWHIATPNARGGYQQLLNNPVPLQEDYLIQRSKKTPIFCGEVGFSKRLAAYFKDCPFLSDLIATRQLTKKDMINIAMYFNRTCGAYGTQFNGISVPGKIVTASDTMDVTLQLFLETTNNIAIIPLQNGVSFTDKSGVVKKVTPSQAKEIRFRANGEDVRLVSNMFMGTDGNVDYKFLKMLSDGALNIFGYYVPPQLSRDNGADYNYKKSYVPKRVDYAFQKGDRGEIKFFTGNESQFRIEMSSFFNDCPRLSRLIERGDLSRENIYEIAMFYKESCEK
jgi:hypothetical protein